MMDSMTRSALPLTALGVMLALLQGTPAEALNTKSYVAAFGGDGNNCSTPIAACATFAQALTQTVAGGEITVVNTGDYGPVTITQSVHVTNDGAGEASIRVASLNQAIVIEAGAGDIVSLRGLVIDGQGSGGNGIEPGRASAVHVQNCVVRNFIGFGIAADNRQLFVSDSIIFNNGSGTESGGIWIVLFGTDSANVVLDRVHLENNVLGLLADGTQSTGNGAHVVIRDSVVSGNVSDGIRAVSRPGQAPAFVLVEHTSSVSNVAIGIHADGPRATILLKDNTVSRNGAGISATNSGQLISYGNNTNNNNLGPEGAPTGFFSQM